MKKLLYVAGAALVLASVATPAMAGTWYAPSVPEIDGASITSGVGLLAGGLMLLRARFGSK